MTIWYIAFIAHPLTVPTNFWYIESVWNFESESQVEDLLAYRSFI